MDTILSFVFNNWGDRCTRYNTTGTGASSSFCLILLFVLVQVHPLALPLDLHLAGPTGANTLGILVVLIGSNSCRNSLAHSCTSMCYAFSSFCIPIYWKTEFVAFLYPEGILGEDLGRYFDIHEALI